MATAIITEDEATAMAEEWVDNFLLGLDDDYGELRMTVSGPDNQSNSGAPQIQFSGSGVKTYDLEANGCTCGNAC